MTIELVLLVVLIAMSGFFSSSETALFSIGRATARNLAESHDPVNQLILKMKQDPHTLLATVLIGNNLVNIGASSLATVVTIEYSRTFFPGEAAGMAVGIATGVMTFLILVFGEIFPKTVAIQHNVRVARLVIYPLYWLSFIFMPIIWFLNFIPRLISSGEHRPLATEAELISFVDVVHDEGEIKPDERQLIYNVVKLDDLSVSDIMTPSADMFVIEKSKPIDIQKILDPGFSRIPVMEGDIDHIVGIVHVKDLFRHYAESGDLVDIEKIMREPYFIPEYKKLDQLLNQFKRKKEHAAIVVNEYGEVTGLITFEDVLEAIVGDITDESDVVVPSVVKVQEKEWLVNGSADIDIVNEKLNMNIPESDDYETFTGYVLERTGRIPKEQEQIVIDNFDIIVKKMEGNRIKTFIVRRK
ncbi:MAG: HlyC/CorC family transporter [Desulfobacteraceae bacterium]|jgi:CBS domain containing-hemolysin-like protein|nr:MAG: HlyC/CorC family transporter [Desulfobacteraceae bacterium]